QAGAKLEPFRKPMVVLLGRLRGRPGHLAHGPPGAAATSGSHGKAQGAKGVRGVGPAERTGKSRVAYWPGGSRPAVSADCRLPRNPREINAIGVMCLSERQNQSYDRFVNVANFVQVEVADYSSKSCIANNLVITKTRDCLARC